MQNRAASLDLDLITDPITKKIFYQPVNLSCGDTLEKDIADDLLKNKRNCPCCGQPVKAITPNHSIEKIVQSTIQNDKYLAAVQYLSDQFFHELIISGDIERIISTLKAHPEKINAPMGSHGYTILHQAVGEKNAELVNALLTEFKAIINVNAQASYIRTTPLYLAASIGAPTEIVKNLLANNADPSIASETRITPLMAATIAFCRTNSFYALDSLLGHKTGLNVNQQDHFGVSALMMAVLYDEKKIFDQGRFAQLLSIESINPNLTTTHNETALFFAAEKGHIEKVKALLVVPGIQIGLTCNRILQRNKLVHKDEMQIAKENGHTKIAALFAGYHLVNDLLKGRGISHAITLDHLKELEANDFDVISKAVSNQGQDQSKVKTLVGFLMRLTGISAPESGNFFNEERDHSDTDALNTLFKFAHETYYSNNENWEKKIRVEAFNEFGGAIENKDANVKVAELKWARSQTLFNEHRYRASIGTTDAVKEFDNAIKKYNPR